MSSEGIARCPRCDRTIATKNGRYQPHSIVAGKHHTCRMSDQYVPPIGLHTDKDYDRRALIVADLAAQLQDLDPVLVWDYLTALPANELQRMAMIALAAIPVDRRIEDVFGWVCDLPIAQTTGATA